MPLRTILLALIGGVTLSGCASFVASDAYSPQKNSKKCLVVLSLTQPYPTVKWMYRDVTGGKGMRGVNEKFISTTDLWMDLIRYEDSVLYPFELAPGKYEIFRWTTPEFGTYFEAVEDFSIQFQCAAGEVTYVGNLALLLGKDRFALDIHDASTRDVAELVKRYTKIDPTQVRVQLMELQKD